MANNVNKSAGNKFTVWASTPRTTQTDTEEWELPAGVRNLFVVIDITAATSTPSTTFLIEGVDRASGKTFTLLQSAALVGVQTVTLRVNDALTVAANLIAKDALPPVIRFTATHGNANSQTYSVGGMVGL